MAQSSTIHEAVKRFLLKEFLPEEDPGQLKEDTPLITSGILDSVSTLKLVSFLESHFDIELEAHEASVDHLNTIAAIARVVESKRG